MEWRKIEDELPKDGVDVLFFNGSTLRVFQSFMQDGEIVPPNKYTYVKGDAVDFWCELRHPNGYEILDGM